MAGGENSASSLLSSFLLLTPLLLIVVVVSWWISWAGDGPGSEPGDTGGYRPRRGAGSTGRDRTGYVTGGQGVDWTEGTGRGPVGAEIDGGGGRCFATKAVRATRAAPAADATPATMKAARA